MALFCNTQRNHKLKSSTTSFAIVLLLRVYDCMYLPSRLYSKCNCIGKHTCFVGRDNNTLIIMDKQIREVIILKNMSHVAIAKRRWGTLGFSELSDSTKHFLRIDSIQCHPGIIFPEIRMVMPSYASDNCAPRLSPSKILCGWILYIYAKANIR